MTTTVDSTLDTLRHSRRVDELLLQVILGLQDRLHKHDESKMHEPEKGTFDRATPRLKTLTYGSAEYREALSDMSEALEHHYGHNRHHPEHFDGGVDDMTLIDVIEMLCDWKAATERHEDGDLSKSLGIQQERFGLAPQLVWIFENTARELGWLPAVPEQRNGE